MLLESEYAHRDRLPKQNNLIRNKVPTCEFEVDTKPPRIEDLGVFCLIQANKCQNNFCCSKKVSSGADFKRGSSIMSLFF